jgi:uncharacterized protein
MARIRSSADVIDAVRAREQELRERFGVEALSIFGSMARGDATPESDVDMLVRLRETPGLSEYMALKFYLEDVLGRRVDLVMEGALKPWARPTVETEAIRVA